MAGLFGGNFDDPKTQGLLQLGLAMMQGSGPSPVRRPLASIIGEAGQSGIGAYKAAQDRKRAEDEARMRKLLNDLQLRRLTAQISGEEAENRFFDTLPEKLQGVTRSEPGDHAPGDALNVTSTPDVMRLFLESRVPSLQKQALTSLSQRNPMQILPPGAIGVQDGRIVARNERTEKEKEGTPGEYERMVKKLQDPELSPAERKFYQDRVNALNYRQPSQVEIKMSEVKNAKERVSENVMRIRDAYADLELSGGAIKSGQSVAENATNLAMNTQPGQIVGRALGTRAQVARDKIAALRPALINEIRSATGMSARAMDSNVELQFYIKMATDTGVDIEVNKAALEYIDKVYGLNIGVVANESGRARLASLTDNAPFKSGQVLHVGDVVNGFRYKGGNSKLQSNWEKVE